MTLTKSYRNNAFLSLLGFTFKKNLGFTLVATIIALLLGPFNLIRTLFLDTNRTLADVINSVHSFDTAGEFNILAIFISILCGVFLVFLILFNFSYLFKKSSSDAFHSFPLKRSELVISRFVPIFLLSLIPLIVSFVGEIMVFSVCKIAFDLNHVLCMLGFIISAMLLCGGVTLVFVICSGTAIDSIFLMAAVGGGIPVIIGLLETFAQSLLYGYASDVSFLKIATYSSPYFFAGYNLLDFATGKGTDYLGFKWFVWVIMAVLGAAFVCLSIYLYNHRKSEKAGEPYAFKSVPTLIAFLVSFVSAILLGMMFEGFDFSGTIIFWGFALFGALLAAVVYGAVAYRGFKKVKKSLLIGLAAFLLVIAVVSSFALDIFGYETRIPEENQVKEVTLYFNGEAITLEGEELILVTDLHKEFLAAKGAGRQLCYGVNINYTLKDNTQLTRSYNISEDYGIEPLFAIYKSQARLDSIRAKFNSALKSYYQDFSYYNPDAMDDNYYLNKVPSADDLKTLCGLYEKEIKNVTFEEFKSVYTHDYKEMRNFNMTLKDEKEADANGNVYYVYETLNLYIYDSMTETIAFLDKLPNAATETE